MKNNLLIEVCRNHRDLLIKSPALSESELSTHFINGVFEEFAKIYDYESDGDFSAYILKATDVEMLEKVIRKLTEIELEKVARKFSEILLEELGIERMQKIIQINKERGDDSCATGDYCDSNQVFIEALEACGYKVNININDQDQMNFNNAAWNLAKKNDFYV